MAPAMVPRLSRFACPSLPGAIATNQSSLLLRSGLLRFVNDKRKFGGETPTDAKRIMPCLTGTAAPPA